MRKIYKSIILFLAIVLIHPSVHAQLRVQNFDTEANGWEVQIVDTQKLGWSESNEVEGEKVGEAVATWSRAERVEFYADRELGGILDSAQNMKMRGKVRVLNGDWDINGQYIGWFSLENNRNENAHYFGIMFNENKAVVRIMRFDASGFPSFFRDIEVHGPLGGDSGPGEFAMSYDPVGGDLKSGLIEASIFGTTVKHSLTSTERTAFDSMKFDSFGLIKPESGNKLTRLSTIHLDDVQYSAPGGYKKKTEISMKTTVKKVSNAAKIDRSLFFGYVGEKIWMNGTQSESGTTDFSWDFGDGTTGKGVLTRKVYDKPGEYDVKLSAKDSKGLDSETKAKVVVTEGPDQTGPMQYRSIIFNYLDPSNALYFPWDYEAGRSLECRFHDLDLWRVKIKQLADAGLNRMSMISQHPYPHLMKIPGWPEAQTISDEELQKNMETFRSIIAIAHEHDMRFQLLVYNILVPHTFKEKHNTVPGQDNEISRAYTRACIEALYNNYPELGEILLTVGETGNAIDLCRVSVVQALEEMDPQPALVIRDQNIHPEQIIYVAGGMNDWSTMVKITEEQYCGGVMGPRGMLIRRGTGKPIMYLQSWYPTGLFESSYSEVKLLAQELRDQFGNGVLLQGVGDELWLFHKAWGYYLQKSGTSDKEDKKYFTNAVKDKFGKRVPAKEFLEAADLIGQALPRVRAHYYGRNWGNMQQYGMLIESYLDMPTHNKFLRPGDGNFYDWLPYGNRTSIEMISIRDQVHGKYQPQNPENYNAEDLADLLEKVSKDSEPLLSKLKKAKPSENEKIWNQNILDLTYYANLATHYAAKTRAALAWERWVAGKLDREVAEEIIESKLDESISAYEKMIDVYIERFDRPGPPAPIRMVGSGNLASWNYQPRMASNMKELLQAWKWEKKEILNRIGLDFKVPPNWMEFIPGEIRPFPDKAKKHYLANIGSDGDLSFIAGFSHREGVPGETKNSYRWSTTNATLRIPAIKGKKYDATIEISIPEYAAKEDSGIYFEDKKLVALKAGNDQVIKFKFEATDEINLMKLNLQTWTPLEKMGTADSRNLGAQVFSIYVKQDSAKSKYYDVARGEFIKK